MKLFVNPPTSASFRVHPQYFIDVGLSKEPKAILEHMMVRKENAAPTKVSVQWKGGPANHAAWEYYQDFTTRFLDFDC